jgi:SAM-dependent methyltransferase
MTDTGSSQGGHYDHILDDYDRHYYDRHSLEYRETFILQPLLDGLDLRGKRVADLASGSGETTAYLARTFPGIQMTGFDVSPKACQRFRDKTGFPAVEFDLTAGRFDGEPFDAAVIMGGLHHCAANLPHALATVATMLRPGAHFLMFEPNRDYVLESARRLWYRVDRYFDDANEMALSHDALIDAGGGAFACEQVRYFGGPAFFLVYNSLVFRIPHWTKRLISPALLRSERVYNQLPGRAPFASFTARWRRHV